MEQAQQRISPHRNMGGKPQANPELSALQPPRIAAKSYHGRCVRNGTEVWVEEFCPTAKQQREQKVVRPLPLQLELRSHSPTGFARGWKTSSSDFAKVQEGCPMCVAGYVVLSPIGLQSLAIPPRLASVGRCARQSHDPFLKP